MTLAFIPSPSQSVWYLGPFPLRGYALCIILGVLAAVWIGDRRWVQRGGRAGTVGDIAVWAVPFGIVGGRIYHVLSDAQLYFGEGRNPVNALYVWRGGLGIWGAIAFGAVGAYIGCRRQRASFSAYADALAPGIVVAQAIGRVGNWFNQELYGKPTTQPWGLEIDAEHRSGLPVSMQDSETFHPTFLYELLWDLGVAGLVIWAERRFKLGYGRAFALYVMAYTVGRGWIEYLRVDTANQFFGVRLNVWTSVVVFLLAAAYFVIVGRRRPGQPDRVQELEADKVDSDDAAGETDDDAAGEIDDDAAGEIDDDAAGEIDDDAAGETEKPRAARTPDGAAPDAPTAARDS